MTQSQLKEFWIQFWTTKWIQAIRDGDRSKEYFYLYQLQKERSRGTA